MTATPIRFPVDPPVALTLSAGWPLMLRPLIPADEAKVVAFHRRLSDSTVHWRWFHAMSLDQRIAHARLAEVCRTDPLDGMAVAAWDGDDIVAIGRLTRCGEDAELAVVVVDDHHHLGLGGRLVDALIAGARRAGCRRVIMAMLPDNTVMMHLAARHGFTCIHDHAEGVVTATLEFDRRDTRQATAPG